MNQGRYYIGLMSGTSMDGIDAALISFENEKIKLINTASIDIPASIKSTLAILLRDENIHLKLLGETDTQMGELFSDAVLELLKKSGKNAAEIIAIGSHGQTIYHHPHGDHPFTLQMGDPNIIAARTLITTVADFRRRDIALGGQGAPLVPAFHDYLFRDRISDLCVINIGGIANITYLPADKSKPMIGFDTGPGNTLLDSWHQKHCEKPIDFNGEWGRNGKSDSDLLIHLYADPYFKKAPPKSTGREYFNLNWLNEKLKSFNKKVAPRDIQATLTELTAMSIALSIRKLRNTHAAIYICGGGAKNLYLMECLRIYCSFTTVQSTQAIDIDPQWIEAMAFAWLAKQTVENKPGNLPSVTGATKKAVLGGIFSV